MFDIGFQELLLIGVIALVIMGPERLPGAVRTATLWISRLRRSFQQIKDEIEREINTDEIKQQLHNESIMKSLEQAKSGLEEKVQQSTAALKPELDKLQYDISDIVKHEADTSDYAQTDNNNAPAPDSNSTNNKSSKTAQSD